MSDKNLSSRVQAQRSSVKNLINWGDHFSVDHPAIDAQHKAIFDLGADVYNNWHVGGSMDTLRPSLEKLTNLMNFHCAFEEKVLAEIGYEGLSDHAEEHRHMLDDLEIMHHGFNSFVHEQEIRSGSLLTPAWGIVQYILKFSVGHVMTNDMLYFRALKASRGVAGEIP